jgi:hypothetical protein
LKIAENGLKKPRFRLLRNMFGMTRDDMRHA